MGHYGIARELSAIYNVPLKKLSKYEIEKDLPKYSVEIKDTTKCNRYVAVEIDGIYERNHQFGCNHYYLKLAKDQ